MAIDLQSIRTAIIKYVDTMLVLTISPLTPISGVEINPNEEFSFNLTVKNPDPESGGVNLKNVIWHVWVTNGEVGKLIVPEKPMVARDSLSIISNMLIPGRQVSEMYLFPPFVGNYFKAWEFDTISLNGKAGSNLAGGTTDIRFKIYAEIDIDWLFPKDQNSITVEKRLRVFE